MANNLPKAKEFLSAPTKICGGPRKEREDLAKSIERYKVQKE